jgi:ribulose kinase
MTVVSTECSEPVLLGSAILGAVAARVSASLPEAMQQFTRVDKTYRCTSTISAAAPASLRAYLALQQVARLIRRLPPQLLPDGLPVRWSRRVAATPRRSGQAIVTLLSR